MFSKEMLFLFLVRLWLGMLPIFSVSFMHVFSFYINYMKIIFMNFFLIVIFLLLLFSLIY